MKNKIAITNFDFETQRADPDNLINVWIPEIEAAAEVYVKDDRFLAFLLAGLRLGGRFKTVKGLRLTDIVKTAGYSRSTFFRIFGGRPRFLCKGYQLTCLLWVKVYAKYLNQQELNLDDFCKFTMDVFYGASCSVPNEVLLAVWREHNGTHSTFHPHLAELATVIHSYLGQNRETQHLKIDTTELDAVLRSLDLIVVNARLEDSDLWRTPLYYNTLSKMLKGYLSTCICPAAYR